MSSATSAITLTMSLTFCWWTRLVGWKGWALWSCSKNYTALSWNAMSSPTACLAGWCLWTSVSSSVNGDSRLTSQGECIEGDVECWHLAPA